MLKWTGPLTRGLRCCSNDGGFHMVMQSEAVSNPQSEVRTPQSSGAHTPDIHGPLPGPKAQPIHLRDDEVISPSYTRSYPFVMDHGKGSFVWDVDGNRFIDFTAGVAVLATGHA